jgi:DNA-binding beta-propeller fold protein YncE
MFANDHIWAPLQSGAASTLVEIVPVGGSGSPQVGSTTSLGNVDPIEMAYDSNLNNIWITDYLVSMISVVNISAPNSPSLLVTFSVPEVYNPYPPNVGLVAATPEGILYDSTNGTIWVAPDTDGYAFPAVVFAYTADTVGLNSPPQLLKTSCSSTQSPPGFPTWPASQGNGNNPHAAGEGGRRNPLGLEGNNPDGLAYAGGYIWVTNSFSNQVQLLNPTTGCVIDGAVFNTGNFPLSMASDGTNVWVGNGGVSGGGSLTAISISNMSVSKTVSWYPVLPNAGPPLYIDTSGVRGLLYQGDSIWTCNSTTNTITRVRAADGFILGTYPVGPAPRAIDFDGTRIWVANSGDNTLSYFDPAKVIPSSLLPSRYLLLN